MNEEIWLAVLKVLPSALTMPIVIFETAEQAGLWWQANDPHEGPLWIMTMDQSIYWIVGEEVGRQLLQLGFTRCLEPTRV
ncbi:hypothetical protein [Larkinella soli]|uniref:hypothetical protein n=1 Tax=Larkinella soli TaxID=1770527 RepID=UPI000FFC3DE9|nr:hypothetical protein [Larkinella soli]